MSSVGFLRAARRPWHPTPASSSSNQGVRRLRVVWGKERATEVSTTVRRSQERRPRRPPSRPASAVTWYARTLTRPHLPLHFCKGCHDDSERRVRSFQARRAFRALRSLVKLQALARGSYVRKQAGVAIRFMKVLVRLQVRVRARQLLHRSKDQ